MPDKHISLELSYSEAKYISHDSPDSSSFYLHCSCQLAGPAHIICEEGQENDCSSCYKLLVIHSDTSLLMLMLIIVLATIYFIDLAPDSQMKKIKNKLMDQQKRKKSKYVRVQKNYKPTNREKLKWTLRNQFILSLTFVLYVLGLSLAAVRFSNETESHSNKKSKFLFSLSHNEVAASEQRVMTSLPMATFFLLIC